MTDYLNVEYKTLLLFLTTVYYYIGYASITIEGFNIYPKTPKTTTKHPKYTFKKCYKSIYDGYST